MLVTQSAHTTGIHDQRRLGKRLTNPADGKGPEDMAMADNHHITRDAGRLGFSDDRSVVFLADLGDQVVDARDDVLGALAAGTPVPPDVPGPQALRFAELADLCGRDAFVVPVVPFGDACGDGHRGGGVVW